MPMRAAVIDAGADKVSVNTAALADPSLLTRLAARYGSQAVISAIDAKRRCRAGTYSARSGTASAERDAVEWAREAESRGAGEILLTSMDRDGTRAGFDCALTAAVASAVSIPVIASGGAGTFDHFLEVFTAGQADAALGGFGVSLLRACGLRPEGAPCSERGAGEAAVLIPSIDLQGRTHRAAGPG